MRNEDKVEHFYPKKKRHRIESKVQNHTPVSSERRLDEWTKLVLRYMIVYHVHDGNDLTLIIEESLS